MLSLPVEYSPEVLENCHLQEQSLFFTKLPREIRHDIFELACTPSDDPGPPYRHTEFWYRPGHHARKRTYTSLLYICRRAWIEAHQLPMQLAEPTFWFGTDEIRPAWTNGGPRPRYEEQRFLDFMRGLSIENHSNLKRIHIFAQMFWLEGNMWREIMPRGRRGEANRRLAWPPEVKITIKNTDWWGWEGDGPFFEDEAWIRRFLETRTLKSVQLFTLDLETLRSSREKVNRLRAIIDRLKQTHKSIGDWSLEDDSGHEVLQWTRPGNIEGRRSHAHNHLSQLDYCVYRLRWRNLQPNERLDT